MSDCVCGFNPPEDPNMDCERCRLIVENARLKRDRYALNTRVERMEDERDATQARFADLEAAAIALMRATHIGDQNFVGLLNVPEAEPIRKALLMFDRWFEEQVPDDEAWPENQ